MKGCMALVMGNGWFMGDGWGRSLVGVGRRFEGCMGLRDGWCRCLRDG